MVKKQLHIIRIFTLLLLLLLGDVGNEAWGKITYHILSLPFTTYQRDGVRNLEGSTVAVYRENVRVEAFCCWDNDQIIGLPNEYKSPLIGDANYHYYLAENITKSATPQQLYGYNISTYYFYTINGTANNADNSSNYVAVGTEVVGDVDIYVTYTYDPNDAGASMHMDLSATRDYTGDGLLSSSQAYNIRLKDRMLVLNQNRQNRPGAVKDGFYTEDDLTSDDFRWIEAGGLNNVAGYRFFKFQFGGNDPYNVTLYTAYNKPTTLRTKAYNSNGLEQNGTQSDYDKYIGTGKNVYKEYRGASFFAKLSDGVVSGNNMWLSSEADIQWTDIWSKTDNDKKDNATIKVVPGYNKGPNDSKSTYYEMSPIFNSLAILNGKSGGYVLAASKMNVGTSSSSVNNWQPRSSDGAIQYLDYDGNGNNIKLAYKKPSETPSGIIPYEVYTYTFKVKTPFGNVITATKEWSETDASSKLKDNIPDALKRKYVTITGAYKDEALTIELEDFAAADAADNGRVIWLKYEVGDMGFEALSVDKDYKDARWYTIRMNGDAETQYIAHLDNTSGNFYTGGGSNDPSKLHEGENSLEAQVAFVGDPYELRIISHKASEAVEPNADRYIGCPFGTTTETMFTAVTSFDICSWEIMYDDASGSFKLRQFGTYDDPWYFGWNYSATNKPIIYTKSSASYIKVVDMAKKTYYYHIYNSANQIAVKASASQDVGMPLKYTNIPEIIRSPLIQPGLATLKFYSDAACTNEIIHAPFNVTEDANKDIYVKYTITGSMPSGNYRVRLNIKNIYYDSSTGGISSSDEAVIDGDGSSNYIWHLDITDPYAMIINNTGIIGDSKYVKVNSWVNKAPLVWDVLANASKFIVKSNGGVNYEVMAPTGDDVDAATEYYNIGRTDDEGVLMYGNGSYTHTLPQIRFALEATDAKSVDFHLIDKENKELLVVTRRTNDLIFPDQYRSPLVSTYHYWKDAAHSVTLGNIASADEVGGVKQVYVTYDTNSLINLKKGQLYLLKFHSGDTFRQEDGADGLIAAPGKQAVYPYCNGDCNFFVYGQDEYDLQQQGAASTRTRWAWYVESANNDPYHVKICSRQQETYDDNDHQAYFYTSVQHFKYPDEAVASDHVVTTLAWPGITGVHATEYMVLGTVTGETRNFQLVTSPVDLNNDGDYGDSGERVFNVVKSFEQYWKTYDTIKNKLLKDILRDEDKGSNPEGATKVPTDPASYRELLTGTGAGQYGFHSYDYFAYAKRFNGYNVSGESKKGWEKIEHWYQTVNMGEGYFDFEATVISPVMILLDQHGWEIMRKPLPYSDQDPDKEAKKNVLRTYDSPMVKEYAYWATAKKRTGLHQYYQLDKRIGGDYTSTSLGDLPPWGSENILDAKGNQYDEYVTYIVKDEYAQSYDPSTKTGSEFLIQQGNHFASATNATTIGKNDVPSQGGMSQYIITYAGSIGNDKLWTLKPNADIDNEQGYLDVKHDWGDNPNAYEETDYKNLKTAQYINDKTLGKFSFSNGFDPYNIQISSAEHTSSYFITNATGATLTEGDGAVLGTYSSDPVLALGAKPAAVTGTWYDSRKLSISNATFMAVQDLEGNMQLMPRFDQARRVRDFSTLVTPTTEAGDPTKLPETHTQLFRPMVYNYHIIDNGGQESLCYKSGGDMVPQTPDHFKSPLAKDFTYYKTLTSTGTNTYDLSTLADEITESGSLIGAGLTSTAAAGNNVYVRYAYDEEADVNLILKGKWFTMQLNAKDAKYDSGIKEGSSKPTPMDATQKAWQWKFLETPLTDPDPYAVCLFNRAYNETRQNEPLLDSRFALLSHTSGYALAKTGSGPDTYQFLNGSSMSTSDNAAIAVEFGFKSTSCSYSGTDSQVKLFDDVSHTYKYKVYTKANAFAIEADQSYEDALENEFKPVLPEAAKSPMLNMEDFRYYYNNEVFPDTIGKSLQNMYGLYDDVVYVHYMPYNPDNSTYLVPNDKTVEAGHAARGSRSNDAALGLDGNFLYNIIWYNDNMMKRNADNVNINGVANQPLQATDKTYVWQFEGNDPYAIKIKSYGDDTKYINSSGTLSDTPQTFMLIAQDGYAYGVLAVTGDESKKLTMAADGSAASIATTDSPTQYVIFALSTNTVIYHLMIKKTNEPIVIPYCGTLTNNVLDPDYALPIKGSTQRNLTSVNDGEGTHYPGEKYALGEVRRDSLYCKEVGPISLGDKLEIPSLLYRPNVVYEFYVEGVYNDAACTTPNADLNNLYKGTKIEYMGHHPDLVGKTVFVNVVYSFNGTLETNAGADFVRSVAENKWYTFEAKKADGTPQLTQYTNAWGTEVKEERGTHYTNDYLWTPLGDPYGFKMYHRYTCVNSGGDNKGEPKRIMTTNTNPPTNPPAAFAEGDAVIMGQNKEYGDDGYIDDPYSIYELLEGDEPGYFKIHPVANMSGTQYYFDIVHALEPGSSTVYHDYVKLSATKHTDFTFGLTEELVKPYYDRAGYVGGLTAEGKAAYEAANGNLMTLQGVVYNPANIVTYAPGYYRLHSPSDIEGLSSVRYASGYTHKIELSNELNSDKPVPMHFYEVEGKSTKFDELKSKDGASVDAGYTVSKATRGDIPIPAVEYDPASIFYFYEGDANTPMSRIQTQGLYVKGEKGPGLDGSENEIPANVEAADERAAAIMTETEGEATSLYVMDIGGAILLIHDNVTAKRRGYLKYLSYDQVEDDHIYDLKLTHNTHTDHAKWLMQPANHLGLRVTTHSGGDGGTYGGTTYNYTSFYAPFDVLLPDTVMKSGQIETIYHATILESAVSPWSPPADLHPKSIGRYNTAANGCPTGYVTDDKGVKHAFRGNDRFIPAGTPVLIAMHDAAGYVKMTLPNSTPHPMSSPFTSSRNETNASGSTITGSTERTNILSGQYLEQKLALNATQRIFTFGLPFTGEMTLVPSTGEVEATLPLQDNYGMGFYLNANPDKELGLSRGDWDRNNWYVYGNKAYYHATGYSSPAPSMSGDVQFVPVIFNLNDEENPGEEELQPDGNVQQIAGDNCIYDLQGRKMATEQQVKDGTWRQLLKPGIYIINGKKIAVSAH